MKLVWSVLALLTIIVVKGGWIIAFFAAKRGLISFDCFVIIAQFALTTLYLEAMYGDRKKDTTKRNSPGNKV